MIKGSKIKEEEIVEEIVEQVPEKEVNISRQYTKKEWKKMEEDAHKYITLILNKKL